MKKGYDALDSSANQKQGEADLRFFAYGAMPAGVAQGGTADAFTAMGVMQHACLGPAGKCSHVKGRWP